jgi:DNA invertase Pin-like site-specific DNA recombinase
MEQRAGPKRRSRTGDPKVAIAYLRVSTDLDRQELGAEAQRNAIETWSSREGVTIAAWYVEEASGGAPLDRRPIFLEAIAATAVYGAGSLVVQRLDRFSRDGLTAALAEAELQRNGATLAIADGAGGGTDPTAALIRGILLSVAQFEKAMIKARIVAALAVKKRRGELTGKAPFGSRVGVDGRSLEPDPRERAIQARFRELRSAGLTLRAIASCSASEGITNRAGKPYAIATIHNLVSEVAK